MAVSFDKFSQKYKDNLLKVTNADTQRNVALANKLEAQIATHLITISSLLITIIGGFILAENILINDGAKVVLIVTLVASLLSIGFGLVDFYMSYKFHIDRAIDSNSIAEKIVNDDSKTLEELEKLGTEIANKNSQMPIKSSPLFKILQSTMFSIGMTMLLILIMVRVYS